MQRQQLPVEIGRGYRIVIQQGQATDASTAQRFRRVTADSAQSLSLIHI